MKRNMVVGGISRDGERQSPISVNVISYFVGGIILPSKLDTLDPCYG